MKTPEQTTMVGSPETHPAPLQAELSRTGDEVKNKAVELKDQALQKSSELAEKQSTRMGETLNSLTQASSEMRQKLSDQGQENLAKGVSHLTDQLQKATDYLQDASGDQIVGDLKRVAGKHPIATMAGLLGLGLVVGRALRASTPTNLSPQASSTDATNHSEAETSTEEVVGNVTPMTADPMELEEPRSTLSNSTIEPTEQEQEIALAEMGIEAAEDDTKEYYNYEEGEGRHG